MKDKWLRLRLKLTDAKYEQDKVAELRKEIEDIVSIVTPNFRVESMHSIHGVSIVVSHLEIDKKEIMRVVNEYIQK